MDLFGFWIVCAIAAAVVAAAKGRSAMGWFFLSLLLFGIIGLVIVIALPTIRHEPAPALSVDTRRPCPVCKESIMEDALRCRFCGADFKVEPVMAAPAPRRARKPRRQVPRWRGSGDYVFEVVGEASYQDALEDIAGAPDEYGVEMECSALLIPEPANPHDPNAVAVMIEGRKVAYLSRRDAIQYQKTLSAMHMSRQAVEAAAVIVGGWDRGYGDQGNFGVKLDIAQPMVLEGPSINI